MRQEERDSMAEAVDRDPAPQEVITRAPLVREMLAMAGRRIRRLAAVSFLPAFLLLTYVGHGAGQSLDKARSERFERFQTQLNGVVLEGYFTIAGETAELPTLKRDRYEIRSVKPMGDDDLWLFDARITYDDHDLAIPLPLPVRWAGETPVISLDSVTIPGLGTFSARVVMDGTRYAGTWQHDEKGGHLFGRIRKADNAADANPADVSSE